MWRPTSWADIEGLVGVAEETLRLDFKRELGNKNEEAAKDIAAMTLNEGTLVYGVDGDKAMGVVRAITPVAMDVTLICTGPALGVDAFGLICPSVAAGPGLASACGLIRSLSAPLCGA